LLRSLIFGCLAIILDCWRAERIHATICFTSRCVATRQSAGTCHNILQESLE
jgi:hypothetical protein